MSEPASTSPDRWRFTDLLLAELLGLALVITVAVGIWGSAALPWTTAAEKLGNDSHASTEAAQTAVLAFLEVDYRRIDKDTRELLDLSTYPFRNEYAYGSTDLRVATIRAKSRSTALIRTTGLKNVKGDTAQLLVGADTVLRTTETTGRKPTKSCPHAGARCNRYRFLVTLTRVEGRWLLSNLSEVP